MLVECRFNLGGIDICAAANDQVRPAINEVYIIFPVAVTQIAQREIPFGVTSGLYAEVKGRWLLS